MRLRTSVLFGMFAFTAAVGCGGGEQVSASRGAGGSGGVVTGAGGATTGAGASTSASTAASSVVASSSGTGGGASCPSTPPIVGSPITAPTHQWTWVDVPGSRCRDGSASGFGVRLNPASKQVMIYLEGGGACFNGTTCAIALGAFGKVAFDAWAGTVGGTGIFDDKNADNPVMNWNAIYVPYCSGDVHAGDATGVSVPGGPQGQTFVGYENVGLYLQRIVPTFADATQVLLTGISAGGFGAALNYDRVAAAFCPTPVVLLDDSGPPMSDQYLAPCLQKEWRDLWNLAATLPAGCADCSEPNGGGIVNYATYLAGRWPGARLGLISSTQDSVISTFYGFGTNGCTSSTPLPGAVYAAGLDDLRKNYLAPTGLWGTYFVDSTTHTYLLGPGFYLTTVKTQRLTTWVGALLDGQLLDVGP
jgi:hypothetical protein